MEAAASPAFTLFQADESRDLPMRSEPYSRAGSHMLHQAFQHRDARAMADYMRMHRKDKHRAFLISLIEFRAPDGEYFVGRGMRGRSEVCRSIPK